MEQHAETILNVAYGLFSHHGFKKVTMIDIAQGAGISRPTLYLVYPNKEAVFSALISEATRQNILQTKSRLTPMKTLRDRLSTIFDIWILEPYSEALKAKKGFDLISEAPICAPDAMQKLWESFEEELVQILSQERKKNNKMGDEKNLAKVIASASRDFKSGKKTVKELRSLTDTLISMTTSTFS